MQVTVHFSKIKQEIIAQLQKSTTAIRLAVAWLTDEDLLRVLTLRQQSGVEVHIAISNSIENFRAIHRFKTLLADGAKLFVSMSPFLHHKFCIIDDSIIINGSYNWSYTARTNEENILVIALENGNVEDDRLLIRFQTKHKYLCHRCCYHVQDFIALKVLSSGAKDYGLILSSLDSKQVQLRDEFEQAVKFSIDTALKVGVKFDYSRLLDRMKSDGGGVFFVKRIVRDEISTGEMKSGFHKLEAVMPPRIDLSLEYLVANPRYSELFREDEILFCRKQMNKYNITFD